MIPEPAVILWVGLKVGTDDEVFCGGGNEAGNGMKIS